MANHQQRQAKLDEDIAKLEEELYGIQRPNKVPDDDNSSEQGNNFDTSVDNPDGSYESRHDLARRDEDEEITREDLDQDELATLRKELAEVTHRFGRYKGSTDKTIHGLRQQLASAARQISTLQAENADLLNTMKSDTAPQFSEEVRSVLGEETTGTLETVIKTMQDEIDSLKAEKRTRELQEIADPVSLEEDNAVSFQDGLVELVPNALAQNQDPLFIKWLNETIDDSGFSRMEDLKDYAEHGDYRRAAKIFKEFSRSAGKAQGKVKLKDSIASRRDVVGNSRRNNDVNRNARQSEDVLYQSEINKYLDDMAHGKFKYDSAKAEAFERKIFEYGQRDAIVMDTEPIGSMRQVK